VTTQRRALKIQMKKEAMAEKMSMMALAMPETMELSCVYTCQLHLSRNEEFKL